MQDTCKVDDCTFEAWARGWCSGHYQRWRRTGDPVRPKDAFPPLDGAFADWFSGFFDGEGSLMVTARTGTEGFSRYRCIATIVLRADDAAILQEIQERFAIGRLMYLARRNRGNTKPAMRWTVDTKRDAGRLVEILDAHPLRAKKARDYAIWREAVAHWLAMPTGRRWLPAGLETERMEQFKADLINVRKWDDRHAR